MAKADQKTKAKRGLMVAKVLPIGGEIILPSRPRVHHSPMADPVYSAPMPSVSIIIVKLLAIYPSQARPAIITETHIIGPETTDNRPTPIDVINTVVNIITFLEPSLLERRVNGTAPTKLAAV